MTAERPAPVDPEHLLAEDPFVRGLARHLLRDPDAADDLAQQTWLAALQRGPRGIPLRHWLVAVMRRLCARDRRAQQRELARRRAAAHREPVPSTDAIVAREALRAEVVAAVLALDEPHRDVVLLRFFEHLPPRAIARRLGLPVETVRTRQKRALKRLRQRLDGRHGGDRAAWCALLLPFAHVPAGPVAALSAGVLAMTTKAKLVATAAAFAGVL